MIRSPRNDSISPLVKLIFADPHRAGWSAQIHKIFWGLVIYCDTSWSWFSFIGFWFPLDPYFWEIDFSFTGRRRSPRQAYIWRPTQGGVHRSTKYFDDTSWSWTSFIGFGFPFHPDFWWFGFLLKSSKLGGEISIGIRSYWGGHI